MNYGAMSANIQPSIGYAISASTGSFAGLSGGGRMSFPVSPASLPYSHFKHVSGVLAPEGTQGVTINKLKILDVLIEQLSRMKKRSDISPAEAGNVSADRINALIDQYEQQIKQASAANAVMPYNPAPQTSGGALLNLVA
ncbi:hypothetical protein AGMMS49579_25910 [Spirochaetia bacterium]|nr:hypothetical protein AGMMS49579_25910 [Spirochaetia bacterium]